MKILILLLIVSCAPKEAVIDVRYSCNGVKSIHKELIYSPSSFCREKIQEVFKMLITNCEKIEIYDSFCGIKDLK